MQKIFTALLDIGLKGESSNEITVLHFASVKLAAFERSEGLGKVPVSHLNINTQSNSIFRVRGSQDLSVTLYNNVCL